jgi:hypothetical protein
MKIVILAEKKRLKSLNLLGPSPFPLLFTDVFQTLYKNLFHSNIIINLPYIEKAISYCKQLLTTFP